MEYGRAFTKGVLTSAQTMLKLAKTVFIFTCKNRAKPLHKLVEPKSRGSKSLQKVCKNYVETVETSWNQTILAQTPPNLCWNVVEKLQKVTSCKLSTVFFFSSRGCPGHDVVAVGDRGADIMRFTQGAETSVSSARNKWWLATKPSECKITNNRGRSFGGVRARGYGLVR